MPAVGKKKETAEKISLRHTKAPKRQPKNDQTIAPGLGPSREEDPLRVATELSSSDLEIIQLLHRHIAKLESEKATLSKEAMKEEEASRVQIVFEVYCHGRPQRTPPAQYFDEPIRYDPSSDFTSSGPEALPSKPRAISRTTKGGYLVFGLQSSRMLQFPRRGCG
jgi:hypothetical protein